MRKKPNTARSIWRTLHLIIINVRINHLIQRGRGIQRWRIMIRPQLPESSEPLPMSSTSSSHSSLLPSEGSSQQHLQSLSHFCPLSFCFPSFIPRHSPITLVQAVSFFSWLLCLSTFSNCLISSVSNTPSLLFFLSFLIQKSQSICTFLFFWQFLHYLFSTTPCFFLCSDNVFFSRIMRTWK